MRNFIYAITLVGLGVLQLAIQVVEFARVRARSACGAGLSRCEATRAGCVCAHFSK
jgi:hypothetical protein